MSLGYALAVTKATHAGDPNGWVWSMPFPHQRTCHENEWTEDADRSNAGCAMWAGPTVGSGRWLMREQSA